MDAIDYKALLILQKDGRATWATLGSALHLTPPAVADRVRRLEETGVITGFPTGMVGRADIGDNDVTP